MDNRIKELASLVDEKSKKKSKIRYQKCFEYFQELLSSSPKWKEILSGEWVTVEYRGNEFEIVFVFDKDKMPDSRSAVVINNIHSLELCIGIAGKISNYAIVPCKKDGKVAAKIPEIEDPWDGFRVKKVTIPEIFDVVYKKLQLLKYKDMTFVNSVIKQMRDKEYSEMYSESIDEFESDKDTLRRLEKELKELDKEII